MRPAIIFLSIGIAVASALAQADVRHSVFVSAAAQTGPCVRQSLALKEGETDAAMGGARTTELIFTNKSSSPCTLQGYPRVELLNRKGSIAKRAKDQIENADDGQRKSPELITLAPLKTAVFELAYNSGGAGYLGKPCPMYSRLRVFAPGIREPFVSRTSITSCRRTDIEVTFIHAPTTEGAAQSSR